MQAGRQRDRRPPPARVAEQVGDPQQRLEEAGTRPRRARARARCGVEAQRRALSRRRRLLGCVRHASGRGAMPLRAHRAPRPSTARLTRRPARLQTDGAPGMDGGAAMMGAYGAAQHAMPHAMPGPYGMPGTTAPYGAQPPYGYPQVRRGVRGQAQRLCARPGAAAQAFCVRRSTARRRPMDTARRAHTARRRPSSRSTRRTGSMERRRRTTATRRRRADTERRRPRDPTTRMRRRRRRDSPHGESVACPVIHATLVAPRQRTVRVYVILQAARVCEVARSALHHDDDEHGARRPVARPLREAHACVAHACRRCGGAAESHTRRRV